MKTYRTIRTPRPRLVEVGGPTMVFAGLRSRIR
jgi:hypothetical protein